MLIAFEVKIKLPIILLVGFPFKGLEQVSDAVCGECRLAKDTHNLDDRSANFEVVLDDGNEAVGDNGDVDLYSDGILGLSPKFLDLEVLLNPLEKQLDLPSVLVQECDVFGRKVEVVRIIRECPVKVFCIEDNAPDGERVVLLVPLSRETDGLVSQDIVLSLKQVISRFDNVVRFELLPYDEECSRLLNGKEPGEVKVASVKHIAGKTLVCEPVHRIDVMNLCIGNPVEDRYLCGNVNLGVDSDTRLCTSEFCPTKYRHTKVDGRGIDSIESSMQFKLLREASGLGNGHHMKGKLLKDSVVSESAGFGQHLPVDRLAAKAEEYGFLTMGGCYICKLPKTSAAHKLAEHKNQHVAPMGHRPSSGSVVVFDDDASELSLWKKLSYLSKNVCSNIHVCSEFESDAKVYISRFGQSIEKLKHCA